MDDDEPGMTFEYGQYRPLHGSYAIFFKSYTFEYIYIHLAYIDCSYRTDIGSCRYLGEEILIWRSTLPLRYG